MIAKKATWETGELSDLFTPSSHKAALVASADNEAHGHAYWQEVRRGIFHILRRREDPVLINVRNMSHNEPANLRHSYVDMMMFMHICFHGWP